MRPSADDEAARRAQGLERVSEGGKEVRATGERVDAVGRADRRDEPVYVDPAGSSGSWTVAAPVTT